MLKRLSVENFTVFPSAVFDFSSGLNVFIGENGTGKSHILKLVYSIIADNNKQARKSGGHNVDSSVKGNRLTANYAEKLMNVFRAKSMADFARAGKQIPFALGASFVFSDSHLDCFFTYRQRFTNASTFEAMPPENWTLSTVVFMPTRELLTIYPGFVSLYEGRYLEFEETYYDTCLLLGAPPLKKPMVALLSILEDAMGGRVELDKGRFYLVVADNNKIEMPMVAEGLRKLAMLAQLIAVGALQKGGYLFWDEPEANLNPRLIKLVAGVILQLANAGIQVFIATHSLFLLRELEVLQAAGKKPVSQRYFALKQGKDGVEVEQGNAIDDLQTLVVLDEELLQSDRYMALEQ